MELERPRYEVQNCSNDKYDTDGRNGGITGEQLEIWYRIKLRYGLSQRS